jgi:hypothetical protein
MVVVLLGVAVVREGRRLVWLLFGLVLSPVVVVAEVEAVLISMPPPPRAERGA